MIRTLRQNLEVFLRATEEALRWPYCENEEDFYTERTFILVEFQVYWTEDTPVSLQKTACPSNRIPSEICCLKQEHFSFKTTKPFIKTLETLRTSYFWKVTYYFWSHIGVPSFRDLSTDLVEQLLFIKWHQLEKLVFDGNFNSCLIVASSTLCQKDADFQLKSRICIVILSYVYLLQVRIHKWFIHLGCMLKLLSRAFAKEIKP